ncbi:thioesterase [Ktedonobacteria bacterium brp13]|nr:thioesterase [Ktedonobacteria bacterium brp13]
MLISPNGWIYFPRPNREAELRLFCFPGLGASASLFFPWGELLPQTIEVATIQPAGRTPELDLPPTGEGFTAMVRAVAEEVQSYQDRPFAFFGHSLGAILAFEVARLLVEQTKIPPVHLLFACIPPPHVDRSLIPQLNLPFKEGLAHLLAELSNISPGLVNASHQSTLMTRLHYDARLWTTYRYHSRPPFGCPLTIYAGSRDPFVNVDLLSGWQYYTTGPYTLELFTGSHFFFYIDPGPLLQVLTHSLIEQEIPGPQTVSGYRSWGFER